MKTALEFARHNKSSRCASPPTSRPVCITLPMDIVLLPLTNVDGVVDRFLGLYQPNAPLARLRGLPADRLAIVTLGEADGVRSPTSRASAWCRSPESGCVKPRRPLEGPA